MEHYVISISGWTEYTPYWFLSRLSASEFKKLVESCVVKAYKAICDASEKESDHYWDGHLLMNYLSDELKKEGVVAITPTLEIDLKGSCIYRDGGRDDRPDIIPIGIWKKILAHNAKVHKELYKDMAKRAKKAKKGKKGKV